MDPRERTKAAIGRRGPDRLPCAEPYIEDVVVSTFLGCDAVGFEERLEFVSRLGLDAVSLQPGLSPEAEGAGLPLARDVEWPDLTRWLRESDRFLFASLDGAFGWGTRLLGLERFLLAAARNSLQLLELVRSVEALNLELIQRAAAAGADGLVIADDIAYQRGLFFSPSNMRSFFFPSLARQVEAAQTAGLVVFFHCDGDLSAALGDVAEAGFDGLQGIESAAGMDLRRVKEQCPHVCLWGNLDPRLLLEPHVPDELREAARAVTSVAEPDGGLIFGTSSGLFGGMRPKNLRAVYAAVRRGLGVGG